ncbi:DNA-binding protein isoform X1 isoform C [Micractinium conductrix]|nr:DNA-binding protein isoform X1 isoform D [Micractinium conductrix]PSC68381.1 DNA-binding protein isoform X1 isoform C [Micractinium conductrix]|eukprot:PSC68380.1 DNA-binding protein isoform X1 isoform D [Micractinium conductrix]
MGRKKSKGNAKAELEGCPACGVMLRKTLILLHANHCLDKREGLDQHQQPLDDGGAANLPTSPPPGSFGVGPSPGSGGGVLHPASGAAAGSGGGVLHPASGAAAGSGGGVLHPASGAAAGSGGGVLHPASGAAAGSGGGVLHPASGAAAGSGGGVLHPASGAAAGSGGGRGRHDPESEEEGGHPGNSAEETAAAAEEGGEEGAAAMHAGEDSDEDEAPSPSLLAIDAANRGGWVPQAGAAANPRATLDLTRQCEAQLQQLRQEGQLQQHPSAEASFRRGLGDYQVSTSRHPHVEGMRMLVAAAAAVAAAQPAAARLLELGGGDRAANNAAWLHHLLPHGVASYTNVDMVPTSEQLGLPLPQLPRPRVASLPASQPASQPVAQQTCTYAECEVQPGTMDAAVVVNAIDGPASSCHAAALLCSALRPGAPVLLAGSGDRQACFATLLAMDLINLGFSVEACQPDQAGLPFCRPADATSFIILRSPGQPGVPCPPPPAAWLQQQQRHPPPEPPSGPAATSNNGVVYGILPLRLLPQPPPQQQQQQPAPGLRPAADARETAQHAPPVQLQLQQLLQPPPLDMREPADLMAVFQQARQLSLSYGGSTLRGLLVRLREHEAELLAGTHSCLQSQEQPGIDLLRAVLPNEAAVRMSVIDASSATALNRSLDVGPRFVSMPGACVATGAAGVAAQQQQALDLHGDPKYLNKQGGRLGAAAQQQQALDLHGDLKYFNKQGAAATNGFANVPIYSCDGKKWHMYWRKTGDSWDTFYSDFYFMTAAIEEALAITPEAKAAEMHELDAGLNKTTANNTDVNRGAPHSIDESWGLYAGGADKNCGLLARVMAMAKQFGGMRDAAASKCESVALGALLLLVAGVAAAAERQSSWDYSDILAPSRFQGVKFDDLPGFTRSVYERNYAVVTPESHVYAANPAWTNATTAHLISPVVGANFAMYLATLRRDSLGTPPPAGHERFIFVLDGVVEVTASGEKVELHADDFAFLPAGMDHSVQSVAGAGLVVYERRYALKGSPKFVHGHTQEQAVLDTPGEVFALRKLLPATEEYDFNMHVMDFLPGEHLFVKEVHYNQHGLLLLQGKGIYRLGNDWLPVQSGDAIWMAPFVPQWYAALGKQETRYLIYKDTIVDPLLLLQAGPAQAHHADEAVAAERGARLAAEAEVAQLAALLEDQQRSWQEQAAEWQGQLRVAQSALQALQGKVASLHAELAAEQALRQAAEQEAEAARQREAQLLARLAQAEQRQQEQRQQEGQPQQGLQKTQAPGDNAPRAWQEQAQAQGWRHAPPGWLQPMPPQPQQLPSLASRQQQQQALGAASAGGPDRPAGVTQQRLAEVRSWLQQQEQEQQEPTGHAQLPLQRSPQRQQSGPPAWQHQLWQHHQQQQQQQWQSVQQSEPKQHQPDGQLRQQQQQRPATPASGLSCRAHEHSAIVGSEALQPRAVSPRPRSASAKDKPLAVPPTQVDAGALAAARAEYVQEKERIRAKRLRELADSPGFSLQHKGIFDDAYALDLATSSWRELQPGAGPAPVARWKAGHATLHTGLLVVGGDAYTPGTLQHRYTNDVWRLNWQALRWEQATAAPGDDAPLPRRGHSLLHYKDEHGTDRAVLFGGRTIDKVPLNDAWEAQLAWPNVTWRRLAPLQPAAGGAAPAPRRGHSAVLVPGAGAPQMLIYGGRNDTGYYGDLWRLDLKRGSWQRVAPAPAAPASQAPSPRDHHAAALFRGELVIFAGRPSSHTANPVSEVWAFSLAKRTWRKIETTGPQPLPRFEESYVQYQRPGSAEASRLLIFGGQTEHVCQLNDVFELDLERFSWRCIVPPRFCTRTCTRSFN